MPIPEEFMGMTVLVNSHLPGPRPITPAEWAERYVRYHCRDILDQCDQPYPEHIPHRPPRWDEQVVTVYLLPEPREIFPSLDRPSVLPDYPSRADVAQMRWEWEAREYVRAGALVVNPSTMKDLVIISGVV